MGEKRKLKKIQRNILTLKDYEFLDIFFNEITKISEIPVKLVKVTISAIYKPYNSGMSTLVLD